MTERRILQKTETRSLHETILEACLKDPDGDALVSSAEPDRSYTRGEVADLAGKIAYGLVTSGFSRGGRIGLLADNCPEWGIIYLAILSAGGIVVPIDPSLKKTEQEKLLAVAMIQYLFVADDRIDDLAEIVADRKLSISIIGIRDSIEGARTITDYENTYIERETDPSDTAVIIYTAGTTGAPKGVVLTHRNLTANLESIKAALTVAPGSVFLSMPGRSTRVILSKISVTSASPAWSEYPSCSRKCTRLSGAKYPNNRPIKD
jgi:long-subunit acyl-CoA synthetase (AMP-forming)